MATWTQKQIAALTGSARDLYDQLVREGTRPAEALNIARSTYGSVSEKPVTAAPAETKTVAPDQVTTEYLENLYGVGTTGTINPVTNTPVNAMTGQPLDKTTGKSETRRFYLGKGKDRMLVIQYDDGTEQQSPAPEAGIVGEADAGATKETENAIELLTRTFANYGLGSLAGVITDFVRKGYKADTISLMLQDTPEYKRRFAANEARKKAGLAVLSPAEYLATEAAYRQVMSAAGLPKGFYDSTDDFTKFIANDMSPSELNARVSAAEKSVLNADTLYQDQLRKLYGLSNGEMIAYALDPEKALPIVERRAKAVDYATAAAQQGVNVGLQPSEYYAGLGVTEAQARQGFSQIAQTMPTYEKLQNIYGAEGQDVLTNLQAAAFGGTGQAQAEQDILKKRRQEIGQFSGSSGVGQTSLSGASEAGAL